MRAALRAAVLAAALASEGSEASEASEAPLPPEPTSPPGACYVHLQECDGHPTGEWFAIDPESGQPARRLSETAAAFAYVEKDGNTVCEDHGLHSPANADACSDAAAERGVQFGTFPHGPRCHLFNGKVYYNPNGDLPLGNSPPLCDAPAPQPTAASAPSPGLRFITDPGTFVQEYSFDAGTVNTLCSTEDLEVQSEHECRQASLERGYNFVGLTGSPGADRPKCYVYLTNDQSYFNTGTPSANNQGSAPLCRKTAHTKESANQLCSSLGLDDPATEEECALAAAEHGKSFQADAWSGGYPPCHASTTWFYWTTGPIAASSSYPPVCRRDPVRSCVPSVGNANQVCNDLGLRSPYNVGECFTAVGHVGLAVGNTGGGVASSGVYDIRPACFTSGTSSFYNPGGDVASSSYSPICCKAQYVTGNVGETCTESGYMDVESVGDCRAAANDVDGLAFTSLFDGSNPTAQRCTKNGDTVAYWYNYNADAGVAPSYASHKPVCRNIPAAPTTCGCHYYAPACYRDYGTAAAHDAWALLDAEDPGYVSLLGTPEAACAARATQSNSDGGGGHAAFCYANADAPLEVPPDATATLAALGRADEVLTSYIECPPPPSPPPPSPRAAGDRGGECRGGRLPPAHRRGREDARRARGRTRRRRGAGGGGIA